MVESTRNTKNIEELKIIKLITNFREICHILIIHQNSANLYWSSYLNGINDSISKYIPPQVQNHYFPNGLLEDSTQFLVQLLLNLQNLKNNYNDTELFIESMYDWRRKIILICEILLEGYESILVEVMNYFNLLFSQLLNLNQNAIESLLIQL